MIVNDFSEHLGFDGFDILNVAVFPFASSAVVTLFYHFLATLRKRGGWGAGSLQR